MKKMAIIHTSFVSVNDLAALCKEILPGVAVTNIVDDSLLPEVRENGGLTKNVTRRICAYAVEAQQMGCDAILNQCSSVGEAVDVARELINIPYVKVDEPMAEKAAAIGGRIAVIATVPTTLGPSCRLVESAVRKLGTKAEVIPVYVDGAFDVLLKQGSEAHNAMLINRIREVAKTADCIVLAQGSMVCVAPMLADMPVPVFTSPRLGIERMKDVLGV
ncbi:MAG: aspartate/glutamate racemase family protein [Eubacteriales bacterium]|nr:aspartate/glutamate racemase family protein [Eubacteriales bacterium]